MKRVGLLLFCLAFGASCASTGKVQQQIQQRMSIGDYPGALAVVEQEKRGAFGGKNRLLFYLEKGMLLHIDGRYQASNRAFEEAKRIGNELYTESVSEIGFSLLSNDYSISYAGENFERTLIHLFSALNYAALHQPDSALVEVRQIGEYLKKLQIDSSNENVYQEDAFARYLSALLYESSGELDSAWVDYKKAVRAYGEYERDYSVPLPASLLPNAERVASRLGDWAQLDLRDLRAAHEYGTLHEHDLERVAGASGTHTADAGYGDSGEFAGLGNHIDFRDAGELVRPIESVGLPPGTGEVVILHYNGLSPIKVQDLYLIPFVEAWPLVLALQASADDRARGDINRALMISTQIRGVDLVPVAFPKFVDRPYAIEKMAPRAEDAIEIRPAELVEDVGEIAKKDLADRIVRIRTKAIARAALKFALQKAAEIAARQMASDDESRQLFALATQIAGNITRVASERADRRVWSTLPDEIWMASVVLPEGAHDIEVDFLNARRGVVESRVLPGVHVVPGRRQFVIVRTVQ